jgi:hypothetical protein
MNYHITTWVRRLAARATRRIVRRQRRLSGRLQASDSFARQAGWTITRTRLGGRTYRDQRFGQLSATSTPGPPHQPVPPAAPTRHLLARDQPSATSACRPDGTAREDLVFGSTSKPPAGGRLTSSVDDCRITKENQL